MLLRGVTLYSRKLSGEKSDGKAKSLVSLFKSIKIFFTISFFTLHFLKCRMFQIKMDGVFSNTVLPSNFEKYYPEPLSNPGNKVTFKKM